MNFNLIFRKIVIICFIFLFLRIGSLKSQTSNDFLISGSVIHHSIIVDESGHLNILWSQSVNNNSVIYFTKYNTEGSQIAPITQISNTYSSEPSIAIKNNFRICVWRKLSLNFNSYIYGNIYSMNDDTSSFVTFNDNYYDAERFSPDVDFLNDSSFIVVWTGQGPYTQDQPGLYGQKYILQKGLTGNNITLTDAPSDTVAHNYAKITGFVNEEKFLVTWIDNREGKNNIFGRFFSNECVPIDSSFLITENTEDKNIFYYGIAKDSADNFVCAWTTQAGNNWVVKWRWFDKNGISYDNSKVAIDESGNVGEYSSVDISVDQLGKSVLVWEGVRNNKIRVFAQRYSIDRTPYKSRFEVSLQDTTEQIFPHVKLDNDLIYFTWQSNQNLRGNIYSFDAVVSVNTIDVPTKLSGAINISQNFPNPFNPSTQMILTVNKKSYVSVNVYNILGEKVAKLIERVLPPGKHTIYFDSQNMPSGIYLYKVESKNYTQTKKMLLLH